MVIKQNLLLDSGSYLFCRHENGYCSASLNIQTCLKLSCDVSNVCREKVKSGSALFYLSSCFSSILFLIQKERYCNSRHFLVEGLPFYAYYGKDHKYYLNYYCKWTKIQKINLNSTWYTSILEVEKIALMKPGWSVLTKIYNLYIQRYFNSNHYMIKFPV